MLKQQPFFFVFSSRSHNSIDTKKIQNKEKKSDFFLHYFTNKPNLKNADL